MLCHEAVDHREAQPGAGELGRVEGLEDLPPILGGDAGTIVLDGEDDAIPLGERGSPYDDAAAAFVRITAEAQQGADNPATKSQITTPRITQSRSRWRTVSSRPS